MYELDRTVTFKGILYRVLQVLENDLLLVAAKDDLDNKQFPLPTAIIPDPLASDTEQ